MSFNWELITLSGREWAGVVTLIVIGVAIFMVGYYVGAVEAETDGTDGFKS